MPPPEAAQASESGERKGRKGWATKDQEEYLESLKPAYLIAQATKKTADFWPPLYDGWFKRWSLGAPSKKDLKKGRTETERQQAQKLVGH